LKKQLILVALILSLTQAGYCQDFTQAEVMDPEDIVFRSHLEDIAHDVEDTSDEYNDDREFQSIDPYSMPLFKQIRLRLTNKYIEASSKEKDVKTSASPRWKFWAKKKNTEEQPVQSDIKTDLEDTIENATSSILPDADLSLEGGINAEETEKQLMLDSENISFDEETGDIISTGSPVLYLPPQNTKIVADTMTYNDDSNILKGIGNVVVTRDGKPMKSDYVEINMNEESMLMDNLMSGNSAMKMKAEKGVQKDGLLILDKGTFYSDKSSVSRIASRMVGPRFEDMIVDPEAESLFFGNPEGNNLRVDIDSIYIDARRNHDMIKLKNIRAYHKDRRFLKWPGLTAYTNKKHTYFEANYPEFGSKRKRGMFAGPGFAFGGPFGSVVKIVPFINYKKDFGIGGLLKYVNTFNRTEFGYGTSNEIFFLRGKQQFDDNLYLHYGINSYSNEWFLGGRMAKYMAELYYDKSYKKKNFLAEGLDLTFRHKIGFGLMQDDDRNFNGEKFKKPNDMSTTRTRYMAEINQSLYKYENIQKRAMVDASVVMQGSAALYGTGDTQFIARIGPRIRIQYKNWMQDLSYYLTGYDDQTPMPRYDAYRYGKQSVRLTEAFRLNKYISVGWSGYVNLSDDAPNGKMFQENAFLVSLGPDDLKIIFGYDFQRQRTYFGFNMAFDPKGTVINYNKMTIKNPEHLGKTADEQDGNDRKVAFAKPTSSTESSQKASKSSKPAVLKYAQVIDIEDPDKERID
jgi:hypothetical protein